MFEIEADQQTSARGELELDVLGGPDVAQADFEQNHPGIYEVERFNGFRCLATNLLSRIVSCDLTGCSVYALWKVGFAVADDLLDYGAEPFDVDEPEGDAELASSRRRKSGAPQRRENVREFDRVEHVKAHLYQPLEAPPERDADGVLRYVCTRIHPSDPALKFSFHFDSPDMADRLANWTACGADQRIGPCRADARRRRFVRSYLSRSGSNSSEASRQIHL